jgi:hypothetical protein
MDGPHGLYAERETNPDLGLTDMKIYSGIVRHEARCVSLLTAESHLLHRASPPISILDLPSLATWQLAAAGPRTVADVHLLTVFLLYCTAFYISWPWCRFVWGSSMFYYCLASSAFIAIAMGCGERLCSTTVTAAETGTILQRESLNLHMPIYLTKIRATQGLPITS